MSQSTYQSPLPSKVLSGEDLGFINLNVVVSAVAEVVVVANVVVVVVVVVATAVVVVVVVASTGLAEGDPVGFFVGPSVGADVGILVRISVLGEPVGSFEGVVVGPSVPR